MFLMGMFAVMEEPENYGRLSDEKLLLKIAKGDQEAFRQLYQNTDKTMYSFILSVDEESSGQQEEIMQETYLQDMDLCGKLPGSRKASGMDVYHSQESLLYEIPRSEA